MVSLESSALLTDRYQLTTLAKAGLLAARAAYLAGMSGSSTILADLRFGVPVYGTMAHSFVQAHDDEAEAFLRYARDLPDHVVLPLDTYDTEEAHAAAKDRRAGRTIATPHIG